MPNFLKNSNAHLAIVTAINDNLVLPVNAQNVNLVLAVIAVRAPDVATCGVQVAGAGPEGAALLVAGAAIQLADGVHAHALAGVLKAGVPAILKHVVKPSRKSGCLVNLSWLYKVRIISPRI